MESQTTPPEASPADAAVGDEPPYQLKTIKKRGGKPGETEMRVVWRDTVFQLHPDNAKGFMVYLQKRPGDRNTFIEREGRTEALPDDFFGIAFDVWLGQEPLIRLWPMVLWCNENVQEAAWERFQKARRAAAHRERHQGHSKHIDVPADTHERLEQLAKAQGTSIAGVVDKLASAPLFVSEHLHWVICGAAAGMGKTEQDFLQVLLRQAGAFEDGSDLRDAIKRGWDILKQGRLEHQREDEQDDGDDVTSPSEEGKATT